MRILVFLVSKDYLHCSNSDLPFCLYLFRYLGNTVCFISIDALLLSECVVPSINSLNREAFQSQKTSNLKLQLEKYSKSMTGVRGSPLLRLTQDGARSLGRGYPS